MSTIIKINKFEPLTVECPEKLITPIMLYMPDLRLTMLKFDLDGMIPDAPRIVADAQVMGFEITTPIPVEIPYTDFMEFLHESLDYFKEAHAIAQKKLDETELMK